MLGFASKNRNGIKQIGFLSTSSFSVYHREIIMAKPKRLEVEGSIISLSPGWLNLFFNQINVKLM